MSTNNKISFKLKTSIYPLSAIMTTAYSFLERAYVHLDTGSKGQVVVELKGKQQLSEKEKAEIKGEFNNELLNCALREYIAKENSKIREYIVGQALYSSVQENAPENKTESWDDPLGIAVPWEEKYGEKARKKTKKKKALKVK